jgi:quercetin 2,3-dioxygenase
MLKNGGLMHGFQIWVNLPARLKMIDPDYQDVPAKNIPVVPLDNGGSAKVIAGEAFGVVGPVRTHTPIHYIDFTLAPNTSATHSIPRNLNVMLYLIEGQGHFGTSRTFASAHESVVLDTDGELMLAEASGTSNLRFLLLAGEPINEPIARAGRMYMLCRL